MACANGPNGRSAHGELAAGRLKATARAPKRHAGSGAAGAVGLQAGGWIRHTIGTGTA